MLTNPCGASVGRLQRPLVNILVAVFAMQSHYIFRDREIFFIAGKMNMINWTINTLIQKHKSAQRHNASINTTTWRATLPVTEAHTHMHVFIMQSLVLVIEMYTT